jgi:hypothetical protein
MTIDHTAFAAGMGLLAGAFNRTVDAPISRVYFGILSQRLTTAEFERAITLVLSEETFWPSPAVILGKVVQDDSERALAAFEHVNRVVGAAGGHRFLSHDTYQREFDAATRAAISAVGGIAEICNTVIERWPALERRFVKAYSAALVPSLPTLQDDPKVKQLVTQTARALSESPSHRPSHTISGGAR